MPVFREAISAETSISTRRAILYFLYQLSLATKFARSELLEEPAFIPICSELLNLEIETISVVKLMNAVAIEPEGKRQITKHCIPSLSRLTWKFQNASEISQLIGNCAESETFVKRFTSHNLKNPELLRVTIGNCCLRAMTDLLPDSVLALEYILTHPVHTRPPSQADAARSPRNFVMTQCPGLLETLETLGASACLEILKN